MKNVSNFYTLKYIKIIFLLVIALTAVFCALYLIIFDLIYFDLIKISELNISLFQSTIWMSNVVSSLISMRYVFNYTLIDYPIKYNSFIIDKSQYFERLRNISFVWYQNVITNFGNIEENIHLFFDQNNEIFWNYIPISYPDSGLLQQDFETLPLSLSQVLSENNNLLKNDFFSINYLLNMKNDAQNKNGLNSHLLNDDNLNNKNHTSNGIKNSNNYSLSVYQSPRSPTLDEINLVKIDFSGFLSIENSINNLLPKMLELLVRVPNEFQNYNISNMKFIIIIIIAYGFTLLLFMFIYSIFLYLTNKNMQEGLEKVCRIKLPSIEETIKRIEQFNEKCLSKYRQSEGKATTDDFDDLNENEKDERNSDKFRNFGEGAKYKSLNVLSYSYLQVLVILLIMCGVLIPIYFISYGMIDDSNKILSVQNYIFGKSLTASASTVFIKCMISVCKINTDLNYKIDFVNRAQIENIIRDIAQFTELSDFYNNKFLLNACLVTFNDTTSINYQNCVKDKIIQSTNNTDSLLKFIDETVDTISKDKDIKIGKPYIFGNNQTVAFTNPLLFETNYFRDMEYAFYNYITPISDNFADVVSNSLNNYLLNWRGIIIILISVFGFIVLLYASYVGFFSTDELIHLLSVSRCIFRIIPTNVITNTAELESWIENKY